MDKRVFAYTAVTVSVIFALLFNVLPKTRMHGMHLVMDYLRHILPALAVAALLKYILFNNTPSDTE